MVKGLSLVVSQRMAINVLARMARTSLAFRSPTSGILIDGLTLVVYPLYPSQLERILVVFGPACYDLERSGTSLLHGPVGTCYAALFQSSNQRMCLRVGRMRLVVVWRLEGSKPAGVEDLASVEADSWEQVAVAVDDTPQVVAATAVDNPELEAAATLDASLGAARCRALGVLSGADEDLAVSGGYS
jgi:hypothetical protein